MFSVRNLDSNRPMRKDRIVWMKDGAGRTYKCRVDGYVPTDGNEVTSVNCGTATFRVVGDEERVTGRDPVKRLTPSKSAGRWSSSSRPPSRKDRWDQRESNHGHEHERGEIRELVVVTTYVSPTPTMRPIVGKAMIPL